MDLTSQSGLAETPKNQYGMKRAGFMKYQKCQLQLAAYALGLEHTVNIRPELCMTFVATRENVQVFAIQPATIEKYKQKWLSTVEKYTPRSCQHKSCSNGSRESRRLRLTLSKSIGKCIYRKFMYN